MRAIILLAAFALPVAGSAAPPAAATRAHSCASEGIQWAQRTEKRAEIKRLGELPPGAMVLTVVRKVEGCARPVVVRYGIGAIGPGTSNGR